MYSVDCLKVFNELQECHFFHEYFPWIFFLNIYIYNTNVGLDSDYVSVVFSVVIVVDSLLMCCESSFVV